MEKGSTQTQLLDINFPLRAPRAIVLLLPIRQLLPNSGENMVENPVLNNKLKQYPFEEMVKSNPNVAAINIQISFASADHNEAQSSSSPVEVSQSKGITPTIVVKGRPCTRPKPWKDETTQVLVNERKVYSKPGVSQRNRGHEYFGPTVSSIMKKQNEQQPPRFRQSVVQLSPRWNF